MTTTLENAVHESARAGALDIYLAALLAPRNVRDDLIVLAAFKGEIESIPLKISEPLVGQIRLQWWRDQLGNEGEDARSGNPVTDALRDTIKRRKLDPGRVLKMLDAQLVHLHGGPVAGIQQFHDHLADFDGAAFTLAAKVLAAPPTQDLDKAAAAAGRAYGTARHLTRLRTFASRGYWPLPYAPENQPAQHTDLVTNRALYPERRASVEHAVAAARAELADAKALLSRVPKTAHPAFLPLALVEPYFKAFTLRRGDPLMMRIDLSRMERIWRLWMASMRRL